MLGDTRIVISHSLRNLVLVLTQEGHPGIVVMKRHVCSKVRWPGLDQDAEHFYEVCYVCQLLSMPCKPEPMQRP